MIEILQWSVGVRRVDLATEVSILLSFRLPLCEKYVETAHRIYIYGGKSVYQRHSEQVTVPELVIVNRSIIIMTTIVFSIGKLTMLLLIYINNRIIGSDKLIKIRRKL